MAIGILMESADDPIGNPRKDPCISLDIPSEFQFPWLPLEVM